MAHWLCMLYQNLERASALDFKDDAAPQFGQSDVDFVYF